MIIDGYNLMGWLGLFDQVESGEIELKEARKRLLNIVKTFNKKRKVKIIFDGRISKVMKKQSRISRGEMKIIFSRGESADDYIKRIADENSIVVTIDKELKQELEDSGKRTSHPIVLLLERDKEKI